LDASRGAAYFRDCFSLEVAAIKNVVHSQRQLILQGTISTSSTRHAMPQSWATVRG